jgi:hypothetical protein
MTLRSLVRVRPYVGKLILDLQFFALERGDEHVVMADVRHFVLDLPIEFPVPSLEGGYVAFSRHYNSFQLAWDICIVTKISCFVDFRRAWNRSQVENRVQIADGSVNRW